MQLPLIFQVIRCYCFLGVSVLPAPVFAPPPQPLPPGTVFVEFPSDSFPSLPPAAGFELPPQPLPEATALTTPAEALAKSAARQQPARTFFRSFVSIFPPL